MKYVVISTIIILLSSSSAQAWFSSGDGGYAGEYLTSFSGSSRGLGIGLAQTALGGESSMLYSNPASMASLWWQEISFTVTPLFNQGQFTNISYGYPFDDTNAAGITFLRLTSGDAEKTNELGETIGTFSDQETAITIGYGRKISDSLHSGCSLKIISQEIDTISVKALGMDAGLIYRTAPNHAWGLSLINLLPPQLGADSYPLVARAGFCRGLFSEKLSLTMDVHFINLLTAGPLAMRWFSGLEYFWSPWLEWRIGLNQKQASIGFGISTHQIDFDYAFIYHPLDVIHSITLNLRYGFLPTEAEKRIRRDWDDLKKEKDEYKLEKEKELRRLRFEVEQLKIKTKLSIKFVNARKEFDEKKYSAAQLTLESILKDDPAHEEAQQLLSEIKSRMNTETIVRRIKDARSNYMQGKFADALLDANYILELQPDNIETRTLAYLCQAQIYISEKKYKEAKGELIEVLKIDPNNRQSSELLKRIQTVIDISAE